MNNEICISGLMKYARELLQKKRYHDVVFAMTKATSLWKQVEEAKRLTFEAIDGLLAVDVKQSSMSLVYPVLEIILLARGTNVQDKTHMSTDELTKKATDDLHNGHLYDSIEALLTSYKCFGRLRPDQREMVSDLVLRVIEKDKEMVYSKQLNEAMYGGIIRLVCGGAKECSCCSKDDN